MLKPEPPPLVFFDADVVLAAAKSKSSLSASRVLFGLCELGLLRGVTSGAAREEAERHCLDETPAACAYLDDLLQRAVTTVPDPSDDLIADAAAHAHAKDVIHLATARAVGCGFLVTRNLRDYRPPAEYGITCLDPGQLVLRIRRALSQLANRASAPPASPQH